MGIGLSGPDYSQITVKGLIGSFYDTLEADYQGSWASSLGVLIPSNQSIETYRWLGLAPQLREWLNARQVKGLPIRSYTIENKEFEATLGVDRNEMRFDKTGTLMLRMGELAQRAAQHWEKLLTDLIEADGLCWDGQNFFDTDHSMGGDNASTYQNELDSTDIPSLNVTAPTVPTANEAKQILVDMASYFYTYKDNAGEPYNGGARQFAIMVNPTMMGAFHAAIRADRLGPGSSGGGDSNTLKTQDFSISCIVNPRLTSTDVVYMFRTDSRMKPFILQDAIAPTMEFLGEGTDEAFKFNRYLFGVRATRNVGYGQWAHAMKCTLS